MAFGMGDMAQLGLGLEEHLRWRRFPALVRGLAQEDVAEVAVGALHSLARTRDGRLYSWGCNDDAALGRRCEEQNEYVAMPVEGLEGVEIVQIAAGCAHSLALSADGHVYCWGTYRYVAFCAARARAGEGEGEGEGESEGKAVVASWVDRWCWCA